VFYVAFIKQIIKESAGCGGEQKLIELLDPGFS